MLRIYLFLALACALLAASCGGGDSAPSAAASSDSAVADINLELSPLEVEALASGDMTPFAVSFGDPELGPISMAGPPPGLGGGTVMTLDGEARTASTGGKDKKDKKAKRDRTKIKCKDHKRAGCRTCWNKCSVCWKHECKRKETCDTPEEPECRVVGICNVTERFWNACDCCAATADVEHCAKVLFSDDDCDKRGVEVVFSRDGVEIGRAETNAEGIACFTETAVVKGDYTSTVCVEAELPGGDTNGDGQPDYAVQQVCADLEVVVYTTCIEGWVTGKGMLPACDPANTTGFAKFEYRLSYKDGNFQGTLTYMDGGVNIVAEPITWMVIVGRHAWFGNGAWMAHTHDGGRTFSEDFFELYRWDTGSGEYHNGGQLLNCYSHVSYKWTHDCDKTAPGSKLEANK